jgi:glycosyltransferase involved in cell wall biosynthesis
MKISVIMAAYNSEKFIEKTINSILNQTYKDFELIVVNDGSNDSTAEIVTRLATKDPRITLLQKENGGTSSARNAGIDKSTGEYLAFIDADDVWDDVTKLEKQHAFLSTNIDYVLVGCSRVKLINSEDTLIKYFYLPKTDKEIRKAFLRKNCFIASTVMTRKEPVNSFAGFNNDYAIVEDYDLWLKIGTKGKMANLDSFTASYRVYNVSKSSSNRLKEYQEILKTVKEHRHDYPGFWIGYIKGELRIVLKKLKLV